MGEFRVHQARFFEYSPSAIHCLAYEELSDRLAVSRADGSIEIWNVKNVWFQERIIAAREGCTVEAVVWAGSRLFSAGLHGYIHEHDIVTLSEKGSVPSNNNAIWCLAVNSAKTHIAGGTEDGCVVIFNIERELQYERTFDKQEGRILSLAWYEPNNVIVTGGIDNLRIWSTNSGHAIQRLTLGRAERNKETIVWAVTIMSDFTIVSGDSRGKTCFWNGKQGTLKKAINSHSADVLCVCASPDGSTVFSSGIDPTLVQFERKPVNDDMHWSVWVRSTVKNQHTHDVRALAITQDTVVSAGVDCNLIYNQLKGTTGKNAAEKSNIWRRIPPVPQIPIVSFSRDTEVVLLKYANYIELWKLGATNNASDKNGDILALSKNSIKLVQLKSSGSLPVVTATISPSGSHVAYADPKTVRVFSLTMDDDVVPGVAIKKIRMVTPGLLPVRCLAFTPDGSTLVTCATSGSVQVLSVGAEDVQVQHTFEARSDAVESNHLLTVCPHGKYAAVGDHSNNVQVYDIDKCKYVCSLPRATCQPTSLSFHPSEPLLVVAYADHKIYEFDVKAQEYSEWSRSFVRGLHPQWSRRNCPITQIFFHPTRPHLLFVRDEHMFCIINKTEKLPESTQKLRQGKHAIHMCSKFKYILYLDAVVDDFLLVVERPLLAITETLPASLQKTKFGT